jgi:cytochrome c
LEEDFGLLVNAEGAEATYYACTPCHSEMIVVQQGKTREDWDKLFDWMIEEQGMSELDPEERETILDYLAEHYNTDRPNFPSR